MHQDLGLYNPKQGGQERRLALRRGLQCLQGLKQQASLEKSQLPEKLFTLTHEPSSAVPTHAWLTSP